MEVPAGPGGCLISVAMEPLTFDAQVAIVTGAGGGLGRSHALELARRGALVVVNDLGGAVDGTGGSATAAERVVAEIREAGGEAVSNADSVATPEGGAAIVQCALDAFGRVDIVVNNAGILRDAAFKNVTPESLDAVIDVHLKGAFNVLRHGVAADAGAELRPDRQHQLGLRAVRQLRSVELRRGQGRAHGSHPGAVDRGRTQQRARQRHRADRAHPDDRGPDRRDDGPRAHLAVRRVPVPRVVRDHRPGLPGGRWPAWRGCSWA